MATDWKTLLEIRQKYGIPLSSLQPEPLTDFAKQLQSQEKLTANYNTRLGAINEDVTPEETKKKNWFFKAVELMDKSRNATWNAVEDVSKGENSFGQGFREGWTGEEKYYGKDLMKDLGVRNKFLQGVGGFAAEALLDPLNLVSFGAGSFAKGALTGSAKTLSREGAEALAKSALREVSESAIRKTAKFAGQTLQSQAARDAMKTGAEGILRGLGATADDMARFGRLSVATSGASKAAWDDILDIATNAIGRNQDILLKSKGRGLKIAGVEMASAGRMQDIGASLNKKLLGADNVVSKTATKFNDMVSAVFSPKHIAGVDKETQQIFKILEQRKKGARHLLDAGTEKQYNQFLEALGKYSKDDLDKYDKTLMNILEGRSTLDQVPDDLKVVYLRIAEDLEKIGLSENKIRKLKNTLEGGNYAPHVQSWALTDKDKEILQKFARGDGGGGNAMDVYNRAAQGRKFGNDVDVSNILINFDTASDAARRLYLNSVASQVPSRVMDIRKIRKYSDLTGILADEGITGTAAYNILSRNADGLDGVQSFFETSAVKSWLSRALQHNKMVADAGFVEDVKSAFGRTIRTVDEIRDARRAGNVIVMPTTYAKRARIDESILQQLKSFQADPLTPYLTLDDDEVDLIMKYLGQSGQLSNPLRSGDMVALPKGMVQKVNTASRTQIDTGTKALTKMVDKFYSLWKPTVTGLRPDYHIRNLFGSTMNNMYDVGFKAIDPKTQGMAAKVLRKATRDTDTIDLGGQSFTVGEVRDQIEKQAIKMNLHIAEFGDVAQTHQLKYLRAQGEGVLSHPLRGAAEAGKAVGETIEGQVRTSNFLANVDTFLENGMSVDAAFEAAGDQVRKYHFDYGDLTTAEIKGIRRLLPFYTWFRKNAPLQLEELLNKPVMATYVNKWNRNIAGAEGYDMENLPDYMTENMALAMPNLGLGLTEKGNIPMANIGVPQADLAMLGAPGIGRDIASMSNPLLKAPIEMIMNQNMMTGAPIYSNEYEKAGKLASHAGQQFGIANDLFKTIKPRDYEGAAIKPMWEGSPMGITQSLFKEFDTEEAKLDATYSYNRALANKVQYLKDSGVPVPDLNTMDIDMIQQLSDEDIEMIKQIGSFPAVFYKKKTTKLPSEERSTFSQAMEKFKAGMY